MSSGRRFRFPRASASGTTPFATAALALALLLGGCADGDQVAAREADRAAERRAAFDRWIGCVERRSGAAATTDVRTRVGNGCEGHRRDVLRAFPPRMEARLERLMDERTAVLLRARVREGTIRGTNDPVLRRALDAFSD